MRCVEFSLKIKSLTHKRPNNFRIPMNNQSTDITLPMSNLYETYREMDGRFYIMTIVYSYGTIKFCNQDDGCGIIYMYSVEYKNLTKRAKGTFEVAHMNIIVNLRSICKYIRVIMADGYPLCLCCDIEKLGEVRLYLMHVIEHSVQNFSI